MRIGNCLINAKNIIYTRSEERESNGYTWKKNITLTIFFIGGNKVDFTYYEEDLEEYKNIIAELEKELNDNSAIEVLEWQEMSLLKI